MRFNRHIRFVLIDNKEVKVTWKPFGYHKLLLAVFGLLLDGMRGFWIGLVVGLFFDTETQNKTNAQKAKQKHDWRVSYLMLGVFVLQSSGSGSRLSFNHIQIVLIQHFGEAYAQSRIRFVQELMRQRIQVEQICAHLREEATVEEKKKCLQFLFDLGDTSYANTDKVHHSINYIAARMDVPFAMVQEIYTAFKAKSTRKESHYEAPRNSGNPHSTSEALLFGKLGLSSSATFQQVKKAYYKLAKKYHPDSNPGATPLEQKKLEAELRTIIEAYEQICALRGW